MGGRGARSKRQTTVHSLNSLSNGNNNTPPQRRSQTPIQRELSTFSENRKKGMSDEQALTVLNVEEIIRHANREHVVIVNQFGNVVGYNKGDMSRVHVPNFPSGSGFAIIHNHPSGGTFSLTDIRTNAHLHFERMSVVSSNATYILRHKEDRRLLGYNSERLARAYEKAINSTRFKIIGAVHKIISNSESYRNFFLNYHDNWFRKNAEKYGFEYTMELEK